MLILIIWPPTVATSMCACPEAAAGLPSAFVRRYKAHAPLSYTVCTKCNCSSRGALFKSKIQNPDVGSPECRLRRTRVCFRCTWRERGYIYLYMYGLCRVQCAIFACVNLLCFCPHTIGNCGAAYVGYCIKYANDKLSTHIWANVNTSGGLCGDWRYFKMDP